MDLPPLETPTPGRSALPAFLAVEAGLREALASRRVEAARRLAEAEATAAEIRREGEARLRQVLLDAERAAIREAEDRARDRVSRARVAVQRWIDEAEAAIDAVVEAAVERCGGSA